MAGFDDAMLELTTASRRDGTKKEVEPLQQYDCQLHTELNLHLLSAIHKILEHLNMRWFRTIDLTLPSNWAGAVRPAIWRW